MTNAEIIATVAKEIKNMRPNIVVKYTIKRTGVYAFFEKEYNGRSGKEYAQIGGKMFHRIQKPEHIVRILRNDNRLYD